MSIMVDAEFKSLIPPLSQEEYAQLEENCVREGIRDPLVVWATDHDTQILVDGHNRWKIAAEHGGLPFKTVEMKFNNRAEAEAWIIRNQLGRRNITAFVRSELALKLKPLIAAKAKENISKGGQGCQISDKVDTKKELAKVAGVSHDTIHKVETVMEHGTPEIQAKARSGEISINTAYNLTNGYDKTPAQRQKEFMDSVQKEHEEFQEQKKEAVVSLDDARKDESRQKLLALDAFDKIMKALKPLFDVSNDTSIDIKSMSANITEGQRFELLRRINFYKRILASIEQEVKR